MNSEKTPLAVRREHLVAQCARERGDMADQLNLLKAPVENIGGVGSFLLEHRKTFLAGAGLALGLLIARPKRTLALAAGGVSVWKIARNVLPTVLPSVMPVVQRVLPILRERIGGRFQ
ncbi:YqjK family protein [Massilia sp.]|uniref:YqjK family protein n=1 Tax=Massilia sp. TaxID=1882437 RepID=UPI0028AF632D|nr:YqjK family protein [Massilia sp.]